MARRLSSTLAFALALVVVALPTAAFACGGLIAPGHAEVLRRATTLAAWHDGVEHYVTGFQFAGSASSFGYIIPLPAEPTKIQKAGDWTLERLQLEVGAGDEALPAASVALRHSFAPVQVLQQVKIEALDITVVKGGGPDVAAWAGEHGFDLTPDAPGVLGKYSSSGAIFALAKFDNEEAAKRGFVEGQGTVIHFTIPTDAPWVPLRILGLGKTTAELIDADLFLLTDDRPSLAPRLSGLPGWEYTADRSAGESLLSDLRSDRGMAWLPASGMWLTGLRLHAPTWTVSYDLSIDGGGPRPVPSIRVTNTTPVATWPLWFAATGLGLLVIAMARGGRRLPASVQPTTQLQSDLS
ncbi:MAG: DUF2330 domain-containing protein [Actinobacteria bacterium]|nr:DUF2330 domain-containing protein [Actinomycetota bacterium]